MRLLSLILLIIPLLLHAQGNDWPNLNSFKYVQGRIATESDIADKSAIFVLKSEGNYIGKPIDIVLPQYAVYTIPGTNQQLRVVVIQAESAQGKNMYGAIDIRYGDGIISIDTDFKLLGNGVER